MEHNLISEAEKYGITLTASRAEKLLTYAEMVLSENRKHNITGHKKIEDIVRVLILESIAPLRNLKVPRGTRICDIGTGAGVPGIPMGLYRDDLEFLLVDSNEKKIEFIESVRLGVDIPNIEGLCARAEKMGRLEEYRERFDMVLSRAMGQLFIVIETGAPLVRQGGTLYVYSSHDYDGAPSGAMKHAQQLGLDPVSPDNFGAHGIEAGLLFIKEKRCDDRYPRRYSVIKRDSERL